MIFKLKSTGVSASRSYPKVYERFIPIALIVIGLLVAAILILAVLVLTGLISA